VTVCWICSPRDGRRRASPSISGSLAAPHAPAGDAGAAAAHRRRNRAHLKARLVKLGLLADVCATCGATEWLGRPLSLQLHHRNGDPDDNRLENLQLLCPNCHSLTDNWGGRNKRRGPVPPPPAA
jgi:hypothetical protein